MRRAALALALVTLGCNRISSPVEPVTSPTPTPTQARTDCPLQDRDMYGFCIAAPERPPCTLKDSHGHSYIGCVPNGKPEIPSQTP